MLDEMQKDLLKEYTNVIIGKAANMLSEIANQRVLLSVPEIELLSSEMFVKDPSHAKKLFNFGHVVSSSMKFGRDFSGKAYLIFPANKAKLLVDACLGDIKENPAEELYNLVDTDFDVLKEISNILLNCIIGEFGNMLGVKLEFTLPDVEMLFISEDEQKMYIKNNVYILMFYTAFTLAETKVKGVIVVALGMNSLNMIISKLNEILGENDG